MTPLWPVGTDGDYIAARLALARAERELRDRIERVAAARRALPLGAELGEYLLAEGPTDLDQDDPKALTRAVDGLLERLGPAAALIAPTVRNSASPTMLDAGYKVNVIPGLGTAGVDGRVLPGGQEEFTATLDALTGPDVDWDYAHHEVPLSAPVTGPAFAALREALLHFDPGAHVIPYCMSGGTDAKQFSRLGIAGYGFMPLRLPEGFDYQALFHGVDERVPVDALHFGTRVLDRALRAL